MTPDRCTDKVRFSLSDASGVLRFKSFGIIDAPECRQIAEALRDYLVDRPLSEVDVDHVRHLSCPGDGLCMNRIAELVVEYREMWACTEKPQT